MADNPHDVPPFEMGWEGVPKTKDRKYMSAEKLAILLSKQEKGTPQYILLEHELNIRLANIQSRATYVGIVAGLAGTIVGAILTVWLQSSPTFNHECVSKCEQKMQGTIPPPKPPASALIGKGGVSVGINSNSTKSQKK